MSTGRSLLSQSGYGLNQNGYGSQVAVSWMEVAVSWMEVAVRGRTRTRTNRFSHFISFQQGCALGRLSFTRRSEKHMEKKRLDTHCYINTIVPASVHYPRKGPSASSSCNRFSHIIVLIMWENRFSHIIVLIMWENRFSHIIVLLQLCERTVSLT